MNCRVCGGSSFGSVIDLGPMPLVNNLVDTASEAVQRWQLEAVFCHACSLVQLTEAPPPELLFDEYFYFSSHSQTMVDHARDLVRRFVAPGQRVLEIASNDGYLLQHALAHDAQVLGVEPARNIAAHAESAGIPTRCAYFGAETGQGIAGEWGRADVVFANNVLAHVPDPHEIAAGIKAVLAPGGTAHIEVPYVARLVDDGAFDTIYHEHQCYFSVSALRALFNAHDLRLTGVEEIEIHGGSLHVRVGHDGDQSAADRICKWERHRGLFGQDYYVGLARRVERLRCRLDGVIDDFGGVSGYGAAAKGIILLNVFGYDAERIPWVADISPHKQGKFVPGTGQPIVAPGQLLETKLPACLVLPWNIRDEIMLDNRAYAEEGGRFIIPIPEVEVVAGGQLPAAGRCQEPFPSLA